MDVIFYLFAGAVALVGGQRVLDVPRLAGPDRDQAAPAALVRLRASAGVRRIHERHRHALEDEDVLPVTGKPVDAGLERTAQRVDRRRVGPVGLTRAVVVDRDPVAVDGDQAHDAPGGALLVAHAQPERLVSGGVGAGDGQGGVGHGSLLENPFFPAWVSRRADLPPGAPCAERGCQLAGWRACGQASRSRTDVSSGR